MGSYERNRRLASDFCSGLALTGIRIGLPPTRLATGMSRLFTGTGSLEKYNTWHDSNEIPELQVRHFELCTRLE
jgi:hypothetical protein